MSITITSPITGATQTLTDEQAAASLLHADKMIATYTQDATFAANQKHVEKCRDMIAKLMALKDAINAAK